MVCVCVRFDLEYVVDRMWLYFIESNTWQPVPIPESKLVSESFAIKVDYPSSNAVNAVSAVSATCTHMSVLPVRLSESEWRILIRFEDRELPNRKIRSARWSVDVRCACMSPITRLMFSVCMCVVQDIV
jgi:hypothetical protein